jgi:hypothetical protein
MPVSSRNSLIAAHETPPYVRSDDALGTVARQITLRETFKTLVCDIRSSLVSRAAARRDVQTAGAPIGQEILNALFD